MSGSMGRLSHMIIIVLNFIVALSFCLFHLLLWEHCSFHVLSRGIHAFINCFQHTLSHFLGTSSESFVCLFVAQVE